MKNMISFGANLIQTTKIKQYVSNQVFRDKNVSLVELDTLSSSDMKTMQKINKSWDNGRTLVDDMVYIFQYEQDKARALMPATDDLIVKTIALTRQKQNFHKLNSEDILGVEQIEYDKDNVFLDYLQVDPDTNYFSENPVFKRVGTELVEFLKKVFQNKKIILKPLPDAVPFYEKAGFKWSKNKDYMYYEA